MSVAAHPARWRRPAWMPLAFGAAGLAAFVAAQAALERVRAGYWDGSHGLPSWENHAGGIAAYLGALLLALAVARGGPRWWWVPVACLAIGSALTGTPVGPLSWDWVYPNTGEWIIGRWAATGFDWAAVAVPAWPVARRSRPVARTWDRAALATAALAVAAVVMAAYGLALANNAADGTAVQLPLAAAVLVAALAARGPWRAAVAGSVLLLGDPTLAMSAGPALVGRRWLDALGAVNWGSWSLRMGLVALAAGTAWPLATRLWRRGGTVVWLAALNAANLADAALTMAAVGSRQAVEANPLVTWAGLPVKLAVGVLASTGLARWRPAWLRWLTLVLCGVLAWHLAGILAGGAGDG